MVDWQDFYHKDYMNKSGGKVNLNSKNSLFLLDFMKQSIHPDLIKKYMEIDMLALSQ